MNDYIVMWFVVEHNMNLEGMIDLMEELGKLFVKKTDQRAHQSVVHGEQELELTISSVWEKWIVWNAKE